MQADWPGPMQSAEQHALFHGSVTVWLVLWKLTGRHYITCPTRMHADFGVSAVQADQPAPPQPAEQPSQQHAWVGAVPAAARALPLPQWHPEAGGKLWAFVEGFKHLRGDGKGMIKGKIWVPHLVKL